VFNSILKLSCIWKRSTVLPTILRQCSWHYLYTSNTYQSLRIYTQHNTPFADAATTVCCYKPHVLLLYCAISWYIRQALEAAVQLAAAMKYLHCDALPNCMVLHRDLKPENVSDTYCIFNNIEFWLTCTSNNVYTWVILISMWSYMYCTCVPTQLEVKRSCAYFTTWSKHS
jgi:hypothetical protein